MRQPVEGQTIATFAAVVMLEILNQSNGKHFDTLMKSVNCFWCRLSLLYYSRSTRSGPSDMPQSSNSATLGY